MTEKRAKYTQEEVDALGKKGHAFGPDADGHYSYPIDDEEDLRDAILAVGRGSADHDKIRAYIIGRADDMGLKSLIPDNWNSDGSLDETKATQVLPVTVQIDGRVIAESVVHHMQKRAAMNTQETETKSRARPVSAELRTAREEMRGCREERRMPVVGFEMREVPNGHGGTDLVCAGYASVTCSDHDDSANAYDMEDMWGPWQESIVRGAFVKTLKENADVAFLVNHQGVTMARTKPGTLKLSEDLTGLHYEAKLNPARPDVQILRAAVEDGAIDESSFAFRVTRQEWNESYDRRWITEVSLDKGDVSPVNYGANPHTGGHLTMRSAMAFLSARGITLEAWAAALRELRAGKTISQATLDTLKPIHDYLVGADDHAQTLAMLLGLNDEDEEPDDQENAARPPSIVDLILPDHITSAKQKLAAARAA